MHSTMIPRRDKSDATKKEEDSTARRPFQPARATRWGQKVGYDVGFAWSRAPRGRRLESGRTPTDGLPLVMLDASRGGDDSRVVLAHRHVTIFCEEDMQMQPLDGDMALDMVGTAARKQDLQDRVRGWIEAYSHPAGSVAD